MSKPNGDRPIQRLAEALQDCLDEAVERGAQKAKEEVKAEFGPRFDKMDATLRLFWTQKLGGKESDHLPIDD